MTETPHRSDSLPEAEPLGEIPRITRRTLHEEVVSHVRDMIIDGRLAPGTRINEVQVGALLGVSRTPLREAIKTLASEGLVEVVPAKGAVVRRFSEADLFQILEVLKAIEQLGGRLACERADQAAIDAIADLHRRMIGFYQAGNRLEYFKLNQAIHSAIVQASGNAVLSETHTMLQSRIKRARFLGHGEPRKWAGAVAEHEEMVEALIQRDAERLAAVIGRHLDASLTRVRDVI